MSNSKSSHLKMRLSKDGRFVILSLTIMGFAEDLKELLDGKRKTIKVKVLPPKPVNQEKTRRSKYNFSYINDEA